MVLEVLRCKPLMSAYLELVVNPTTTVISTTIRLPQLARKTFPDLAENGGSYFEAVNYDA